MSDCDIVNDSVSASKGSNNRVWLSLSLSFSFLTSSSTALLESIPVEHASVNSHPQVGLILQLSHTFRNRKLNLPKK